MALMRLVHTWIKGFAALRWVRVRPIPPLARRGKGKQSRI